MQKLIKEVLWTCLL